jgi:hypothetical protein
MEVIMTNQEMFDKAWNGLKSQGFERCLGLTVCCMYNDGNGKHCAWGWVDESLSDEQCYVTDLAMEGIGLAATLDEDQLNFAAQLQRAHDRVGSMEQSLRDLAKRYNLIVPE